MGNRTSTTSNSLYRSNSQYGSISGTSIVDGADSAIDEDSELFLTNTELLGFQRTWKRRLALGSMLVYHLLSCMMFTTVNFWIPLYFSYSFLLPDGSGYKPDCWDIVDRLYKVQFLSPVLLYSFGWISGFLMDFCVRKTRFLFVAQVVTSLGYTGLAVLVKTLVGDSHQNPNISNCSSIPTCLEESPSYIDLYTACVCIVSIASGAVHIGLLTLGGDQIPDRDGVRLFYTLFYWCQKAGETVSTVFFMVRNFQLDNSGNELRTWSIMIIVGCVAILPCLFVVVSGKFTRQVIPRLNTVKDAFLMVKEAFTRRHMREENQHWLDPAKHSSGGSFPDQSVEDRVDLFKFAVVMILLIPVCFSTSIPLQLLGIGRQETLMVQYFAAVATIPIMYLLGRLMSRCNKPLAFLHKIAGGHVFIAVSIIILLIRNWNTYLTYPELVVIITLLGITNGIIFTAGYQLAFISPSRAMQCSAMGIFYYVMGVGYGISTQAYRYRPTNSNSIYYNGIGALVSMVCAIILLIFIDRKFNLGLRTV